MNIWAEAERRCVTDLAKGVEAVDPAGNRYRLAWTYSNGVSYGYLFLVRRDGKRYVPKHAQGVSLATNKLIICRGLQTWHHARWRLQDWRKAAKAKGIKPRADKAGATISENCAILPRLC